MRHYYITFLFLIAYACNSNDSFTSNYMLQNYNDIYKKTLKFPKNNFINLNDNKNSSQTIKKKMMFFGNMNCSPCVIKLKEIESYLDNNNQVKNNVDVIYLGLGELTDYFNYQVKENNFSFQVYADTSFAFIKKNKLQKYNKSVFLLNEKNEVIFTGDLLENNKLQDFYKELILK